MHTWLDTQLPNALYLHNQPQPLEVSLPQSRSPLLAPVPLLTFTLISFCFCWTEGQERRQPYLLAQETLAIIGNRWKNAWSLEQFGRNPRPCSEAAQSPLPGSVLSAGSSRVFLSCLSSLRYTWFPPLDSPCWIEQMSNFSSLFQTSA